MMAGREVAILGSEGFHSLAYMRTVHSDLVESRREYEDAPEFLDQVADFIRQGREIGAWLDAGKDRQAAQSILDYWENFLIRSGHEEVDPTLVEFDPTLAPELPDSRCPYLGLDAFREGNEGLFYGRKRLVNQMLSHLETNRLLAVVGPSGSGKSSVTMAGLLPQLKEGAIDGAEDWLYFSRMVPGSHPLENLARAIVPLTEQQGDRFQEQIEQFKDDDEHLAKLVEKVLTEAKTAEETAVLVIDQFEEIFTLCRDDQTRQAFIANLTVALGNAAGNCKVILTMRSDFEAHIPRLPEFHAIFEPSIVSVTPLNASELRDAIEKPAEMVGLKFEEGVVEALLKDILGEPAALPLLQFTLLKLWENRERNRVTWKAYQQLEGGRRALANTADAFYENLIPEEQVTVKRILLRMVRPGEGLEVTSNRVRRETLYEAGEARDRINRVLKKLVDARLVRLTEGKAADDIQVEIAHEALIRNWPRLVEWLEDERERMRRRLRLTAAAEQWESLGRDPSVLWRGVLLAGAQSLSDLNELEAEFIAASQAAEHQAELEKRKAQARELEQARALAQAERRRAEEREQANKRLRWLAGALAVVMVLAVIAAGWAVRNGQIADENAAFAEAAREDAEANAEAAEKAREEAESSARAEAEARATAEFNAAEAKSSAAAEAEARAEAVESALAEAEARAEAEVARDEARMAQNEAERQTRQVLARSLAAEAQEQLTSDTQLSLLLALEAVNIPLAADESPPLTAEIALYRALQAYQLQLTLPGHTDWVNDVAFSADGSRIATASADTAVKVWDAVTGQELLALDDHGRAVTSVVFSSDNQFLASGGTDGFVVLWDPETGRRRTILGGNHGPVRSVVFNADSRLLAVAYGDGTIGIWDVTIFQALHSLENHEDEVNDIAFSPDGSRLVSAGADGRVTIWEPDSGAVVRTIEAVEVDGEAVAVNAIAFSRAGDRLIIGFADGVARVRDFTTEDFALLFALSGHAGAVLDVAFAPFRTTDGQMLMATTSSDGTAKMWDAETGRADYTLLGHEGGVSAIAFNSQGDQFATASQDGEAKVWNVEPGLTPTILTGHAGAVTGVVIDSSGQLVATASEDKTARLWNAETGKGIMSLEEHNAGLNGLAFDSVGEQLATAGEDFVALIWDVATGDVLLRLDRHEGAVRDVAFSPDDGWLATASADGRVRLWDAESGELEVAFAHQEDETAPVNGVLFTLDGSRLIAGDAAGRVTIWDRATGEMVYEFDAHEGAINDLALSPDGILLVTASGDGTAVIWDWQAGKALRTFADHTGAVLSVAFSRDGERLATASADKTARVWDAETGQLLRTVRGHTAAVQSVVFGPGGRQLATASADKTAQVVALESVEELFNRGMELATRPLTAAECFQYLQQFAPERECLTVSP